MGEFDKALSNYIKDFANGGAIRHFVELGYNVVEIKSSLDFPMSIEDVSSVVWEEYIACKIICLEESEINSEYITKTSFVKDYNKYGKTSLRQVTKKVPAEKKDYITCDFGKRIYQDKEGFMRMLDKLKDSHKDSIRYLPWPLTKVYVDKASPIGEAVKSFYELK